MDSIYIILSKHFMNCSNPDEERQVTEFKRSNPVEYEMLQKLWQNKDIRIHEFDTAKAWKSIIKQSGKQTKTISMLSNMRKIAAVAAILVVSLVVAYFLTYKNQPELITYTNLTDNQVEIILSDGSMVWLYKNATLTYFNEFNNKKRGVSLLGLAFFKIEKDTLCPFVITAGNSKITVLGTSFNVNSQPDFTEINVESGVIEVISKTTGKNIIVKKDFTAIVNNNELKSFETRNSNFLSWKTGEFDFNNSPIIQVVKDLNMFYSGIFEIDSTQNFDCNLTAMFKNAEPDEIVQVLETTCNLSIMKSNNKYKIK